MVTLLSMSQNVFAASCSTSECHNNIIKNQFIHSPAEDGECMECHVKLSESQNSTDTNKVHPTAKGPEFLLKSNGEALCLQCHESMADQFEHGPAASGACTTCHNPHGSNEKFYLLAPLQELCLGCHSDFANDMSKAVFIHSAITDLDCSSCHQPHSSGFANLLKGETSESCFECHDNIEEKYKRSLHKHAPLYSGSQCANCHFAHYSNFPALLKWGENDTCLHCHSNTKASKRVEQAAESKVAIADKKNIHAPIEDSGCSACHDAHGSRYGSLVTKAYPASFYAGYTEDSYSLCFSCHDQELLTERNKTTNFRNGIKNLHTVHVADKLKGRTCKACHNVHAGDGEKLIKQDGVPFGDWKIPIRFEVTDTGGSCMPGCHRIMKYDREKKADNSKEAAKRDAMKAKNSEMEQAKPETKKPGDVVQPEPITSIRQ
jgi:predicted CXXCH cytochrome family protein